jgi:hypothetical protein
MTMGDFNGDGKPDLVTANLVSDDVSVLLNNGDGTFRSPISTIAGSYLSSVAVGDFDGDGKLDVAVISSNNEKIAVLLGNGDGTLRSLQEFSVPITKVLAVYDFNGDGLSDIVVDRVPISTYNSGFGVLMNNTQRSTP